MSFKKLGKLLSQYHPVDITIVGLGNACCSDDGAGLIFWNRMQEIKGLKEATFINAGCNPENHLIQIIEQNPKLILFVDAAENRHAEEIVQLYDADEIDEKDFSTHAYSIGFIEKFIKMNIETEIKYLGININNSRPGFEINKEIVDTINNYFRS